MNSVSTVTNTSVFNRPQKSASVDESVMTVIGPLYTLSGGAESRPKSCPAAPFGRLTNPVVPCAFARLSQTAGSDLGRGFVMHLYRSHTCGALTLQDAGQ